MTLNDGINLLEFSAKGLCKRLKILDAICDVNNLTIAARLNLTMRYCLFQK